MKKIIQNITKYIAVFFVTVFILLTLLVLTAKIPKNLIAQNIKESSVSASQGPDVEYEHRDKLHTYRHIYAEMILLNMVWCIDSDEPLKSVLEAKYYSPEVERKMNTNPRHYREFEGYERIIVYNFDKLVDENNEGNVQYLRYWHGSMSIIRPLLVFFNINQIYIINAVLLVVLTIVLVALLIKQKLKEVLIAGIIAVIMCQPWVVPFCLEYFWTFLIMLIASIGVLILEKKEKKPDILFIITGIMTCYLDFLSTELITILIPLLILLAARYKNGRITKFSESIKYTIIYLMEWGLAYVGMWFAKWIIASIVLKINAFDYVTSEAMIRIRGNKYFSNTPLSVIQLNLNILFPLNLQIGPKIMGIILIISVIMEIILISRKKIWISTILLFIATIPYVRYIALLEHSFLHKFFTYRTQMATIIAIILAMIYSWDTNRLKNIIKKVRRKGVNNTKKIFNKCRNKSMQKSNNYV